MPITKGYRFTALITVGPGRAVEMVERAMSLAGFKKVASRDTWTVSGKFHPIIGTLWGDLRVSITSSDQSTTVLVMDVKAAVDNVYTLAESPGTRLARKFTDSLTTLTTIYEAPTPQ